MRKKVFGQPVSAIDVERLRADIGPTHFVRLCGALIGDALADRVGSFALPQISERINVPDGGVDAGYTTPDSLSVPETGGLIGPGRTVYQFKYRDASAASKSAIVQKLARQLRDDFSRAVPQCHRYVLLTNIDLSGAQSRKLRDSLVESSPAFERKLILIWGATEIALALNQAPHLRHLFFSEGGLCTLDFAEEELKAAYKKLGWPPFAGREQQRAAIAAFIKDETVQLLHVIGPRYVGKTRLVIEALKPFVIEATKPFGSSVLWAASPEDITLDLFRDLDSSNMKTILVVDRCDDSSVQGLDEWARSRQRLKTIIIRVGSGVRGIQREQEILPVGRLRDHEASKLLDTIAHGLPLAQESWAIEAGGGLPGLILHIGALLKEARVSALANPGQIHEQLGTLLEDQYLTGLTPEVRRALGAVSLLPVLGIEGEMAKEADAVCRALGLAPGTLAAHLPVLEHMGLVHRRGRFIEVAPPKLAEHLVSRSLTDPEKILAELQLALEPGAFLRFLERFRDLPNETVQTTIAHIFASEWFGTLDVLSQNAKILETLAPAAPAAAIRCLERLLDPLTPDELEGRIIDDVRRALVLTLEHLALRSETFERAAQLLLALAEAENEAWANNATGVLLELFHWQHPEVTVSLSRRLGVLQEGIKSESASRRKIVATACGEAFEEPATFSLHDPKGPALPERSYRPATWDEVGHYAREVLALLSNVSQDQDPEVSQAAVLSLLKCFWPLVKVSLWLPEAHDGLPELGRKMFEILGTIGREARTARDRIKIVDHLERAIEGLSEAPQKDLPAAKQALKLAHDLHKELTASTLRDRLWRWIGSERWELSGSAIEEADVLKELKSIASVLQNPRLFTEHLDWLTGEEARHEFRSRLFQILGENDRGERLFELLLPRAERSQWPYAFSAYVVGWHQSDPQAAETALDRLADSRADLTAGVLAATCSLPPSSQNIERLLRLITKGSIPRSEIIDQISFSHLWRRLNADDAEKLINALDDGTRETRSSLLRAFVVKEAHEITPALRNLAWSFLESALPAGDTRGPHYWDTLAAKLGEQEPTRLLHLVEKLAISSLAAGHKHFDWEHELPLAWGTLKEKEREGLLQMLLRLEINTEAPYWIDWELSRLIDPSLDREVLLQFAREAGVEGARAVALNLDAHRPGFWELARDLIAGWGNDDQVKDRVFRGVVTGSWSGSAIPMINAWLDQAKALLKDSDPGVARWAQEVVSSLEEWRGREEREDREGWIWDYRIRRSELEAMVKQKDSPERLWAIGRLLKHAPKERVLELLTPEEILDALPKIQNLDERTRRMWEGWARHWSTRH